MSMAVTSEAHGPKDHECFRLGKGWRFVSALTNFVISYFSPPRGREEYDEGREARSMVEILTNAVRHPSAWYGRDLASDSAWIIHLGPRHLEEIAVATASVARRGLPFAALTRDDFPLPTLGPR